MYGSMVYIQSAMAEIRRGNKKRRKTEETTGLPHLLRRAAIASVNSQVSYDPKKNSLLAEMT